MENVDNLIIEHLKNLRSEVAGLRSDMQAEFKDVKARLSHLDGSLRLSSGYSESKSGLN